MNNVWLGVAGIVVFAFIIALWAVKKQIKQN